MAYHFSGKTLPDHGKTCYSGPWGGDIYLSSGQSGLGWNVRRYNPLFSGLTLLGEVLETERETLKLKLDIDEGWEPGGPFPYT